VRVYIHACTCSFDGRAVLYPTDEALKDYLRWRQVDAHINNLYNVTFWALVQKGGLTNNQAEQKLVCCVCLSACEWNCLPIFMRKNKLFIIATHTHTHTYQVGSFSKDKNEILFQQFGVNYNELPEVHKKGTVLTFEYVERVSEHKAEYEHFRQKRKFDRVLGEFYEDICKESSKFWREHPYLVPYEPLSDYTKRMNKKKQASSNEEEAL
jgi:tRNA(His) guanylyltransferase